MKPRARLKAHAGTGGFALTGSNVSGTVGQDLSIVLTANQTIVSAQIISGDSNITLDGITLSLVDVSAAGVWTCIVEVSNAAGQTSRGNKTFTLTATAWVGGLTSITGPTMGITTATFGYTLTGSATYAQVAVNDLASIYTLDNVLKRVSILQPNSLYGFFLRGTDGTNFGPWSAMLSGTTLDDNPTPPIPVTDAIRAYALSKGLHTNCQLNRATIGTHPQTAFAKSDASKGNNYTNTTWDTTGWVMGHFEPLAKVGLRVMRSLGGASASASHQAVQIPKKVFYDCYGSRFDYTISQYTQAQIDTAQANGVSSAVTGSVDCVTAVNRLVSAQAECVRTIQAMNEPNNPSDPHYTATAAWPGGWKTICMDQAYVLGAHVASVRASFPSDFTLGMWSPWSRMLLRIRQILWAGYTTLGAAPYTFTGTYSAFTSATLAKQWTRDCLPFYDWTNLHYYTGGRRPVIAGDTNDSASNGENGADSEITLDEVISHYRELCNGVSTFPIWMTENGWELGGGSPDGAIGGRTTYNTRYLTERARMKYYQRQWFENLKRGVVSTNCFELMDNADQVPANDTLGNGKVYGMLKYAYSGGLCTFTRRKLWYMAWCTLAPMFDGNTSTGAENATAKTFTPAALAFALGNQSGGAVNGNAKSLLFQKSTGKWMLALWLDTESWRRSSNAGVFSAAYNETFQNTPVRVTLNTSKSMRSTRPYADADASTATTTWGGTTVGTTFDITVHDDVSYIEIT